MEDYCGTFCPFSLPYDWNKSPLKTRVAVIADDTITCSIGRPKTNPIKNDIAAPAELYGVHFVTASLALSAIFSHPIR